MRSLLYMPLDPASRMVRLILAEKGLTARLVETRPWEQSEALMTHNPAGSIPVLIDEPPSGGEIAIAPATVIAEYLDDAYGAPAFLPSTSAGRAEARRLAAWFNEKFEREVNTLLMRRCIDQRLRGRPRHDGDAKRAGAEALHWHLDYLSWLLENRTWLSGPKISIADLAAAAHLSATDYLGAIPWADFPQVKEWYQRLKCRPSFRPLLADRIDGLPAPPHYGDLDF